MELTNTITQSGCPSCGNTSINLVRIPDYCLHCAARRCGKCDRFLGWERKPKNQQKRQQHQKVITALLKSAQLTEWEHIFLTEIGKQKKLSPKQRNFLEQLTARVKGKN